MRPAAFAIPGDITTPTGGYIYERRLLEGLRTQGRDVAHLRLGDSFPDATRADMADAIAQLRALDPARALILDGFISATLETEALAALHVPTVAMVHHPLALESGLTEARRAYLDHIERANLAHVSHVLVPSPHTAQILTERYGVAPERITIAPPGSDLAPPPGVARDDPPLILSVGLLHPRKGHDTLLHALAGLRALDWRAVIVGPSHDPEHAAELHALAEALDLGDRVRFAGRVDRADLAALYARASIFALATRYEGYGLVFDEALRAGLPIVSCATGAVPDTVPEAAGTLVPVDAPEAFGAALAALLRDPDERARRSAAALKAGAERPGWAQTAAIAGGVLDALPGR